MTETTPKRGRGRPAFDPADVREPVRFRLPAEKLEAVKAKAAVSDLKLTDALEQAIDAWLAS